MTFTSPPTLAQGRSNRDGVVEATDRSWQPKRHRQAERKLPSGFVDHVAVPIYGSPPRGWEMEEGIECAQQIQG